MLAYVPVESKYIDQPAHMCRLINAFAIKYTSWTACILMSECSSLNVSRQFMFVSFRTIKEKKQVCFLLFIHNVQVSINNND